MDTNQILCPQCGQVNNDFSETCENCGIIFIKNYAIPDEQKRKAIAEAEAILEQSQPQIEPEVNINESIALSELDVGLTEKETHVRPEMDEKTQEIQPAELTSKQEDRKQANLEVPMEAIETPDKADASTAEAEAYFWSEALGADPAEQPKPAASENQSETHAKPQAPVGKSKDTAKAEPVPKPVPIENEVHPEADAVENQPEAPTVKEDKPEESQTQTTLTEEDNQATKSSNPEDSMAESLEQTTPAEQEITLEESPEFTKAEAVLAQKEDQTKADALIKQQKVQARTQALKEEKAAQAQAAALKKHKLAQAKAEALKKQKAAQAQAEALKKQKAAQAKALALKKQKAARAKAEALKKQREAQAKAEASIQEVQAKNNKETEVGQQMIEKTIEQQTKLMGLLKKYEGQAIGINYDNSAEIKEAELVEANDEFFSVLVEDKKLQYSYPLKTILSIVEGQEGVEAGESEQKSKFNAVIKVYPLVLF